VVGCEGALAAHTRKGIIPNGDDGNNKRRWVVVKFAVGSEAMWDPKRLDEDRSSPPLRTIERGDWQEIRSELVQLRSANGADNATCAGGCHRIIYMGDAIAVVRIVFSPGGWVDLTFHRDCFDKRQQTRKPSEAEEAVRSRAEEALRSLRDRLRSALDLEPPSET
jgi:hypothetical protein